MIETILQIQNYVYPFQQKPALGRQVKVQDVQSYNSLKDLFQKKSQMQKKSILINSIYLVKLLKIYQQQLTLHYIYEFVPYSLSKYIQKHYKSDKVGIVEMSAKLFVKKISYQLTLMISYLAHMKIEVDLCVQNLGLTQDQKLKLYMNARCKMGHKTQLSLIAYYGQCKQKILNFIGSQFDFLKQKQQIPPNFVIKGNKLVFPTNSSLNEQSFNNSNSHYQSQAEYDSIFNTTYDSNIFAPNQNHNTFSATASCINPNMARNNNLRQTQSPHFSRSFNFSQSKGAARSANKNSKNHKNSFQFGAKNSKQQKAYTDYDDNSDAKSFTHSRSIRIQLQQKIDPNQKKKRKDSYKVKITTFREYQMDDCDPRDLFGKNPENQGDLFQHFEKQAQNSAQNKYKNYQPQSEQEEAFDEMPFEKPKPFVRKQSMPEYGRTAASTSASTKNLQQKVRMAKEKAENVLNRYMNSKKKTLSFGQ